MSDSTSSRQTGMRELRGIILLTASVLMGLALFSYRWQDIGMLQAPPNDPPLNFIGLAGAWFAYVSLMTLGLGAFLLPVLCGLLGLGLLLRSESFLGRFFWGCWCSWRSAACWPCRPRAGKRFAGKIGRASCRERV